MCHGSIDPNILMRDAGDRYRASSVQPESSHSRELPPELMGGLRGVWARIVASFKRAKPLHPAE